MILSKDLIKNFPAAKDALLVEIQGKLYVVIYKRIKDSSTGKLTTQSEYLGRVIDNVFYTMSDYHRLFMRNGKKRVSLSDSISSIERPKSRIKPTVHRAEKSFIDRDKIKHLPDDPFLQFKRCGKHLYVVKREYYLELGVRKEKQTYIGKVVNNCFYSMDEYRKIFKRDGTKKLKRSYHKKSEAAKNLNQEVKHHE